MENLLSLEELEYGLFGKTSSVDGYDDEFLSLEDIEFDLKYYGELASLESIYEVNTLVNEIEIIEKTTLDLGLESINLKSIYNSIIEFFKRLMERIMIFIDSVRNWFSKMGLQKRIKLAEDNIESIQASMDVKKEKNEITDEAKEIILSLYKNNSKDDIVDIENNIVDIFDLRNNVVKDNYNPFENPHALGSSSELIDLLENTEYSVDQLHYFEEVYLGSYYLHGVGKYKKSEEIRKELKENGRKLPTPTEYVNKVFKKEFKNDAREYTYDKIFNRKSNAKFIVNCIKEMMEEVEGINKRMKKHREKIKKLIKDFKKEESKELNQNYADTIKMYPKYINIGISVALQVQMIYINYIKLGLKYCGIESKNIFTNIFSNQPKIPPYVTLLKEGMVEIPEEFRNKINQIKTKYGQNLTELGKELYSKMDVVETNGFYHHEETGIVLLDCNRINSLKGYISFLETPATNVGSLFGGSFRMYGDDVILNTLTAFVTAQLSAQINFKNKVFLECTINTFFKNDKDVISIIIVDNSMDRKTNLGLIYHELNHCINQIDELLKIKNQKYGAGAVIPKLEFESDELAMKNNCKEDLFVLIPFLEEFISRYPTQKLVPKHDKYKTMAMYFKDRVDRIKK